MRAITASVACSVLIAGVCAAAEPEIGMWADGPMKLVLRGDGSCGLAFGDVAFRCRYSITSHVVAISEVVDRGKLQKLDEAYRFEYAPDADSLTFTHRGATRRLVRERKRQED